MFLENLCLGLTHLMNQVEVLALKKGGYKDCAPFDDLQPYTVHRFETGRILSSLVPLLDTWRYTRHFAPDVLFLGHVMSTHGLGALLVKKLLGVPYVVLSHGADLGHGSVSRADNWAMSVLLQNATLVLANSRYTAAHLREVGVEADAIPLLHPGVDPNVFIPKLSTSKCHIIRERFQLGDGPIILSVSRLVPKKNHATVLRALEIVVRQVNDVRYLIVGEGPEKAKLEELIHQLNLERHVVFAGRIDHNEMPEVYAASDLFVMPSRITRDNFESFGIAYVEAGACGKPVIGGRSGGVRDAVIDGLTGLLVDPLNVDETARAILRLLTDPAYARQLGKNGRQRSIKELSWDKVVARLEHILRDVLGD